MRILMTACLLLFFCSVSLAQSGNYTKQEFDLLTQDSLRLSTYAIFNKDKAPNRPTILLVHGGGKSKEIWETRGIVNDLFHAGYNLVAFDIRGQGQSAKHIPGKETYPLEDARAALAWIKQSKQFGSGKIAAIGSSYGSNTLVSASVLSDFQVDTMVILSVTAVGKRVVDTPLNFRVPYSQNNPIKSALYIACEDELARYEAPQMAELFYQRTHTESRKKLILPGRYHGSSLYYLEEAKEAILNWLAKETLIN